MPGEERELVAAGNERQSGQFGDFLRGGFGEAFRRVEAGPDGGPAEREFIEFRQNAFDARERGFELGAVPGEFLSERERHGVLKMRAADLHDVGELGFLLRDGVAELADGGQERLHEGAGGGDVHGRRERVVGRLGHVDVVVRVNGLLRAAFAAEQFVRAVGDDLVHVHVGLRAAAGHPDFQREFAVELPGEDLVAGGADRVRQSGVELAEAAVGERARFLQDGESADHLARDQVVPDVEMDQGTLRLRAPVVFGGDGDRPHAVGFNALCHGRA